jgi:uncharacterized membrane protein
VRRLALLSGRGEPEAERCEQLVRDSGTEWTLLRASWFCQNFSENYLLDPLLAGEVALPVGHVGEPFVDADDIADVAVAALTEDGHAGRLYELTGPRLWTFAQATAEIARVTRRNIRYVELSIEEDASARDSAQVPPEFVTLLTYLFTEVLDSRNARVADGVSQALGRVPRDYTEYVRDTAATGMWNVHRQTPADNVSLTAYVRGTMREISTLDLVTLLSALGCGLNAGVFFAFSTFVMKALGNLPPAQGIAAMQSINGAVINPWFLTPFLGTAAVCVFVTMASLAQWQDPRVVYWLAGSVLYFVGTFLVTMLFNVPRNNALAVVVPSSPESGKLWVSYLSTWTVWNHVRTIAALAAATSFVIAFRLRG